MATLTMKDMAAMLRLSHELHEMPDLPAERARRLLKAMRGLVRADAAALLNLRVAETVLAVPVAFDAADGDGAGEERWRDAAVRASQLLRRRRLRGGRRGAEADAPPSRCLATADRHRGDGVAHAWLHSFLPLEEALLACVSLRRAAHRPFDRRECALVHAFHTETSWIHHRRAGKPNASADASGLAPRQSETLRLMLDGLGEKQIAEEMGLSRNTVHHYVKAIYKHFGVSTRGELMAKWVGGKSE